MFITFFEKLDPQETRCAPFLFNNSRTILKFELSFAISKIKLEKDVATDVDFFFKLDFLCVYVTLFDFLFRNVLFFVIIILKVQAWNKGLYPK